MIPPVGWISNGLLASTFSVGHNAAKNLIFRASSLLLQYAVFNLFSYVAYRLAAYTSFLMLLEDFIQKLYFIRARGVKEHSWIVLAFVLIFPTAGLYDTCIWMLDAPGYIFRSTTVNARSFSHQILPNPSYIISIPGNVAGISLDHTVSADLYANNLTLIATHLPISQEVVAPLRKLSSDAQPRIWLDNEGWSIGFDLGWPTVLGNQPCVPNSTETHQRWSCHLNSTDAVNIYAQSFGTSQIWWDMSRGPVDISSYSTNSTWASLGPNGSSGTTKQIFIVTKSRRRHVLLQTAWTATLQAAPPLQLQSNEIIDFVRRGWNNNPNQIVTPEIQNAVDGVMEAYSRRESYSTGLMIQEPRPFVIRATVIELFALADSITTNTSTVHFSSLRIRSINTTLLRSDSIFSAEVLQRPDSCTESSTSATIENQMLITKCSRHHDETLDKSPMRSSKGRIDVPVIAILPNVLGRGSSNTSQSALDPLGQSWMRGNQAHLDELLTSRALIIQGDYDGVKVTWEEPVAAISYLQIILVAIPALLALFSWILMVGNAACHYKYSFLAAVCATTHISDDSCQRLEYIKNPPRIELKRLRRHVVIGTPNGGTLANVEHDQVVAYSMVTEPLNLPASILSQDKGNEL